MIKFLTHLVNITRLLDCFPSFSLSLSIFLGSSLTDVSIDTVETSVSRRANYGKYPLNDLVPTGDTTRYMPLLWSAQGHITNKIITTFQGNLLRLNRNPIDSRRRCIINLYTSQTTCSKQTVVLF